jgi:hypothetical protein
VSDSAAKVFTIIIGEDEYSSRTQIAAATFTDEATADSTLKALEDIAVEVRERRVQLLGGRLFGTDLPVVATALQQLEAWAREKYARVLPEVDWDRVHRWDDVDFAVEVNPLITRTGAL